MLLALGRLRAVVVLRLLRAAAVRIAPLLRGGLAVLEPAEPGLLPLVSSCLTQLWEARVGDRLTLAGYVGIGGLDGAIAHLADDAYNGPRTVVTGPEHPYFRDVAAMPGGGVGTGYAEAFTAEIQEFVRAIGEGAAMDTDFAAATAMMRVVGAALESHRSGQAVEIA